LRAPTSTFRGELIGSQIGAASNPPLAALALSGVALRAACDACLPPIRGTDVMHMICDCAHEPSVHLPSGGAPTAAHICCRQFGTVCAQQTLCSCAGYPRADFIWYNNDGSSGMSHATGQQRRREPLSSAPRRSSAAVGAAAAAAAATCGPAAGSGRPSRASLPCQRRRLRLAGGGGGSHGRLARSSGRCRHNPRVGWAAGPSSASAPALGAPFEPFFAFSFHSFLRQLSTSSVDVSG
jgi:hypothetical protein